MGIRKRHLYELIDSVETSNDEVVYDLLQSVLRIQEANGMITPEQVAEEVKKIQTESDVLSKNEIEKSLQEQKTFLAEKYYVERIGLFGSYVRNEQDRYSDIDILVEFNGPVGLGFFGLKNYLEDLFEKHVDLVTIDSIKPLLKDKILSEVEFIQ